MLAISLAEDRGVWREKLAAQNRFGRTRAKFRSISNKTNRFQPVCGDNMPGVAAFLANTDSFSCESVFCLAMLLRNFEESEKLKFRSVRQMSRLE